MHKALIRPYTFFTTLKAKLNKNSCVFACSKDNDTKPLVQSEVVYGQLSLNVSQQSAVSKASKATLASVSRPLASIATSYALSYTDGEVARTATGTITTVTQVYAGVTTTVMVMQALPMAVGTYTLTAFSLYDANGLLVGIAASESPFVTKKLPLGFEIQANNLTTIALEIVPTEVLGEAEGGGVQFTDVQLCAFWLASTVSSSYEVAKYVPQESISNGKTVTVYAKVSVYAVLSISSAPVKVLIPYEGGSAIVGFRALNGLGNYVHSNSAVLLSTADLGSKNGTQLSPVWLAGL